MAATGRVQRRWAWSWSLSSTAAPNLQEFHPLLSPPHSTPGGLAPGGPPGAAGAQPLSFPPLPPHLLSDLGGKTSREDKLSPSWSRGRGSPSFFLKWIFFFFFFK